MDVMNLLSGRELLFLGSGAAACGIGATLLHARGDVRSPRVRTILGSLAAALFVSGAVLARAGF